MFSMLEVCEQLQGVGGNICFFPSNLHVRFCTCDLMPTDIFLSHYRLAGGKIL